MTPLSPCSEHLDALARTTVREDAANDAPQDGWPASLFDRYFVAWGERTYRSWVQTHPLSEDGFLRDPYV